MKDMQSQVDHRRIDITKVGVKTITYPITVLDRARRSQKTIATVNMYVNLPHHFKGTHMSRFIEILNQFHGKIDIGAFHLILEAMKERLEAQAAHLEISFPYFMHGAAPAGTLQVRRYDCTIHSFLAHDRDMRLDVRVPIGDEATAGNEPSSARGHGVTATVLVSVRFARFMWLETLIDTVESSIAATRKENGDQGVAPLLVEQVLADLKGRFNERAELSWYKIRVETEMVGYRLFASVCKG